MIYTGGNAPPPTLPPNESGWVNVKDFGAVGDGVTDDAPAFQAAIRAAELNAIRDEFAASYPVWIPPVDTHYRIGSELEVNRTVQIVGAGGRWLGASKLVVDKDTTCFNVRFRQGATAPPSYIQDRSGEFCLIKGLRIRCQDTETTEGYGIVTNGGLKVEDVFIRGFARDGVFINASVSGQGNQPDPPEHDEPFGYYGNADLFYLENVACWANGGNGFRVNGNAANAGTMLMCDATKNLGCGFLDESVLGNTYIGCHAAGNGENAGHNGDFYVCIQVHVSDASNEPGVGVDWRQYWQRAAATVADFNWASGVQYVRSGSYHTRNASARNLFLGCYSEGGVQGACALSKNDTAIGGSMTDGFAESDLRGVNTTTGTSVTVIGDHCFPVAFYGRSDDAVDQYKASLGREPSSPDLLSFGHNDDADAAVTLNGIKFTYNKARHAYEWVRDTTENILMQLTTPAWASGGLSGDNQVVLNQGVILGGDTLGRVRCFDSVASIPSGLVVTEQDFFILTGAGVGQDAFAKVTTPGTVGTDAVIAGFAPLP
ncbi:MAG: glycosyl hydrolase family 28-related protein [Geminicoccaceae bacterium]